MSSDTKPMYVRLPADLHAAISARASEEDLTMAQLVRKALREYVANTP